MALPEARPPSGQWDATGDESIARSGRADAAMWLICLRLSTEAGVQGPSGLSAFARKAPKGGQLEGKQPLLAMVTFLQVYDRSGRRWVLVKFPRMIAHEAIRSCWIGPSRSRSGSRCASQGAGPVVGGGRPPASPGTRRPGNWRSLNRSQLATRSRTSRAPPPATRARRPPRRTTAPHGRCARGSAARYSPR
jgi:hypothetical protein